MRSWRKLGFVPSKRADEALGTTERKALQFASNFIKVFLQRLNQWHPEKNMIIDVIQGGDLIAELTMMKNGRLAVDFRSIVVNITQEI